MRKYTVVVRPNFNPFIRYIYSDCTFNMAMFQLESEGLVVTDVHRHNDCVFVDGTYEGKAQRFIWMDEHNALFKED